MDVIAITDHDTIDGVVEAGAAIDGSPLLIPGVELSTSYDDGDLDILGYFIDPENLAFLSRLERLRAGRVERARQITARLDELGVPIQWERVLELANGSVGRPHIALALIEAGYVGDIGEAFQRYLRDGAPAYLPGEKLSPAEAIDLIHGAGGAAVMAHPGLVAGYARVVEQLVSAGLDGVEVWHPKNGGTTRANLRALAQKHGLVMTGGSDFHRPATDHIGSESPPPECVPALRERAEPYHE